MLLKHIDIDVCLASVGHPQDFWNHVKDEDFVQSLDLSQPSKTIPLAFHVDGVKVYKNQKVWVTHTRQWSEKGATRWRTRLS